MNELTLGFKRRIRPELQTEASECGLACIAMVANHFGYLTDLTELRKLHRTSLKGSTLDDVASICECVGMTTRGLRLEMDEIEHLATPAILHWDLNHFVVLVEVKRRKIRIIDPARGELLLSPEEVSQHFTGVALEIAPGMEFKRKSAPPPIRLSQIVGKVSGLRASMWQAFLLALILEGLTIVLPLLTQWITDEVIVGGSRDLMTTLGLAAMAVGIVMAVIGALRGWVTLYISSHFNMQWMTNVMTHLLRLPVDYFERRHIGDIVSRFGAVTTIAHTLTGTTVEIALDGLLAIGMLCMMLLYSLPLSSVTLAAVALYAALRWFRFGAARIAAVGSLAKHAKEQSYFLETIRGVRSIKLFNREGERRSAWLTLWVDATNASLVMERLTLFFGTTWGILSAIERTAILWLGALAVLDHHLSLGMLMAFLTYKEQFAGRVNSLIDRSIELKMLGVSSERLADIVMTEPEEKPRELLESELGDFSLSLDKVSFRYSPNDRPILAGTVLTIAAGECVAIVGASGCGKTTCLKLLLGILTPTSGRVKLGGAPITAIGLKKFRAITASVMQDDHLFAGSIFDNICFHDSKPDESWVRECARVARIHDEIMAMPMGYHTLVGDMGTVLSGGQKQRVALARALYRRPKILLLDEATSHLDVDTENHIAKALADLDITRIMIAHRPQTIAIADRVLRLSDGRLVEDKPGGERRSDTVVALPVAVTG